ncbi:PaaI family thioesterase [Hyphomonas sp. FCG-A18]|uniref:PaaI family thioesterase n=1 Tax=Hyphomonas sp. FCG-A18 TaxID=3080019 RepID=UPI002B2BA6B3|nr:PaaI family thioesterase [Hyphomonas sp. FCG-A18]
MSYSGPSKMTVDEANSFLSAAFYRPDHQAKVTVMEPGRAVQRLEVREEHLRPGGYVSGPTQMGLADSAAYMAVMTLTGMEPMTVTSNLNINFLRPCIGDVVLADATVMKIGQALAVMDVDIRIEGADKAASQAIVTYALPREDQRARAT